jgi:hypothetical protein
MSDDFVVNGLPLPPLLISLLQSGQWKHPGDMKMREVIPFVEAPVFFYSLEQIKGWNNISPDLSEVADTRYHEALGSRAVMFLTLPWLDVEKSIFIAANARHEDDVRIALDYRTSPDDPRVVASYWATEGSLWREVTPTFTEFVERLGLNDVSRE